MSFRGKVILCGSAGAGKTSLLARYVDDKFEDDYIQTIGANFLIKEIDLNDMIDEIDLEDENLKESIKGKGLKLYLWDLGGQKDKLFANEYYFNQAVGALVIFNLDSKDSFDGLDFWISKLKELSGDIPFIIVGNKSDLPRNVNEDAIKKKVESIGVDYIETSAKLNENVDEAFKILAIKIINNMK
ncbi:MAG: Rab family GTPase [Promethearchaeota archaeon]